MMGKQSLPRAFKNAFAGIIYCFLHERNMKIHMMAGFVAGGLAWWLQLDHYELLVLLVTISSVFLAEMMNTVTETLVDMVSPEVQPLAKIAKDVAAGAVLMTAIIAMFVGYILFWEKIMSCFS